MGIRDWFKKTEPAPAPVPAARRFHDDRARMFDLGFTHRLAGLFAMPREQRDQNWQDAFWDAAWCASVALAEPRVFTGPDGFPYLRLDVPAEGAFDSQCFANLAGQCRANLTGVAFFAHPSHPAEAAQHVVSLGTIDSLLRYDSPYGDLIDVAEASEPPAPGTFDRERTGGGETLVVREAHDILIGSPSSEYLPPPLAQSLYNHLTSGWGMTDPRVQLVVDAKMRPRRSLMIGRRRSGFPEGAPIDAMVQALSWHLDPGRMLMLLPDDWSVDAMTPLRTLFEGR